MAAPSPQDLKGELVSALPGVFKPITSEQDQWLDDLTNAISAAWDDWEAGIEGGGLNVSGSGLSNWTGTGTGGSLTETTVMSWDTGISFASPTQELNELDEALAVEVEKRFTNWVASFSFDKGATYTGTCTATSQSSGTFTASPPGTEVLGQVGSGDQPTDVRPAVEATLKGYGWQPGNQYAEIGGWLSAFDTMIQNNFATWVGDTTWNDNVVTGPGASGTCSGSAVSNPSDGMLQ